MEKIMKKRTYLNNQKNILNEKNIDKNKKEKNHTHVKKVGHT